MYSYYVLMLREKGRERKRNRERGERMGEGREGEVKGRGEKSKPRRLYKGH